MKKVGYVHMCIRMYVYVYTVTGCSIEGDVGK